MGDVLSFPGSEDRYPELSETEKLRMQIQILTAYLDKNDPHWRQKIAKMEQQ